MTVSPRHSTKLALGAAVIGALLGTMIAPSVATAATHADLTLVSSTTTTWRYLDDNTDPAAGTADRTSWSVPAFADSAWKSGKSPFGAKGGQATSSSANEVGGTNFPVTTLLNQFINGTSYPDVPAFFFRTTVTLTQAQIDEAASFNAAVKYDDALTAYVNGTKVSGHDDSSITENLQYGGSNASSPKSANFIVPKATLRAGSNTIAVEIHQGRQDSSDVYFEFTSLIASFTPAVPTITDLNMNIGSDQSQRNLVWYTSEAATQVAQVAKKSAMTGDVFPAAARSFAAISAGTTDAQFSQRTTVTDLEPRTEYVYRVGNTEGWSPVYSFTTGAFTGDYNFLFVGDPQIGASGNTANDRTGWVNTLNTAQTKFPNSEFIFSAGDQVETAGNESHYEAFLAPEQLRSLPLVPVNGNHDVGSKAYEQHFNVPNWDPTAGAASSGSSSGGDYWFRYNDVLYIVLNSNSRDYASHEAFMTKVVNEQGAKAKWKVLSFHHSIYSVAAHTADSDILDRRAKMPETISNLGFDLVLMGHDHSYTRSWLLNKGVVAEVGGVAKPVVEAKTGDVLYVTANSASGSKYYSVKAPNAPFAAVINQENKRNYSNVEVTDRSITITTYRSDDNTEVDKVSLKRADETAPVITTPGDATVKFGTAFDALAGVSAIDAVDGDLTSKITVTGSVNTGALGEYSLVYTVSDAAGNKASVTRKVTVAKNVLTTEIPVIAGTAQVGKTLSVTPGTWTPGTALSYVWTANGTPIPGATAATFEVPAAHVGAQIAVVVTGELTGYEPATVGSAAVLIQPGSATAGTVATSGKAKVGEKLTAKPGIWAAGTALTYSWSANGASIAGATKSTLTVTSALAGKSVKVTVTGALAGYQTVSGSSAAATVAKGTLSAAKPRVTGTVKVGKKLKVTAGKWAPKPSVTYRWYANGKAIKGAKSTTLKLSKSVAKKKITVKVTGKKSGYVTKTVTSKATKKVSK